MVLGCRDLPSAAARIGGSGRCCRGGPSGSAGLVFLYILAITVTAAAQVVGTTLVLSLAITPAAAARWLSANPLRVTALSVFFAVFAATSGVLLSLEFDDVKATVFITFVSFAVYLIARAAGAVRSRN